MKLPEIVNKIKRRPALYISAPSILYLRVFFEGYFCALGDQEASEIGRELTDFQTWVVKKYGVGPGHSWDQVILFFSANEIEALDLFFRLFDEYQSTIICT